MEGRVGGVETLDGECVFGGVIDLWGVPILGGVVTLGDSGERLLTGLVGGLLGTDEGEVMKLRWARDAKSTGEGWPTDPLLTERDRIDPAAEEALGLAKDSDVWLASRPMLAPDATERLLEAEDRRLLSRFGGSTIIAT